MMTRCQHAAAVVDWSSQVGDNPALSSVLVTLTHSTEPAAGMSSRSFLSFWLQTLLSKGSLQWLRVRNASLTQYLVLFFFFSQHAGCISRLAQGTFQLPS
jgi:hypothetical protein